MASPDRRTFAAGTAAGGVALVAYLLRSTVPLPEAAQLAAYLVFGPALVVAFTCLAPVLSAGPATVTPRVATSLGVLGGGFNLAFATVQLNTHHFFQGAMARATDAHVLAELRRSYGGVMVAQNGLNITMDILIDLAAFAWAWAMARHPSFPRWLGLAVIPLVGPHFVLKLVTFPVAPRQAGWFDAGPMVGIWFLLCTIQFVRILRAWPTAGPVAPAPTPG